MKIKLSQVIAKPNNTSIIIYYSKDGKEMRFPTGVRISNEKDKKGKFKDWDYMKNQIKPSASSDFESSKNKIESLVNRANEILLELFKKNVSPSVQELKELLGKGETRMIKNSNDFLSDSYENFYEKISKLLSAPEKNIISLKDYKSTKNLISDFDIYTGKRHKIFEFNKSWCEQIYDFMKRPHINEDINGKIYKTKGLLNPKTCKKRFDIIKRFAKFLSEEKVIGTDVFEVIKNFANDTITIPIKEKTTLDIDEIYQLYEFQFNNTRLEKARDIFVFICFTGLRYGDYKKFDSKFIKKCKKTGVPVYERTAAKTKNSSGEICKIPLCDIAIEILEKYKNKLPKPANPNAILKKALKTIGLFDDTTNIIDKNTGLEKCKWETISVHRGRASFITNLVEVTPLTNIMKMTGHSKLSTLQTYIDLSRDVDTSAIEIFNKKNNGR